MEDFQVVEFDYKVQQILVKREHDKVETIEKEHNETSLELEHVTTQIALLDLQMSCNKTWVAGLLKQIDLTSNGFSVSSFLWPIDDLETMPMGSLSCIIIIANPICKFFKKCNNIFVLSYGCTYRSFCLGLHLEPNATHYVVSTCEKLLLAEWLATSSF